MILILCFMGAGLMGYILGLVVGKWIAEQKLYEMRSELGLDEDEQDEWDRIFNGDL